ncbi:flagellar basal-body MS-ring/collar protein FliF [Hydrogenobacter sp. T-2]|uniref:flagellar basal-body MS-ring/collar protein FliF n=1 Tax=Pampinifervens diazotrophicum TaxID=1632018 RepID=UPI002B2570FF|nr:flagellar basal-body MS-ring/collar protein FliF [Hydrogenobacter sp. T-2]WPM31644.1 flagellar basal-body MS-ring/collar protein FliF [Hydrogenobacter sp. T-2]
MVDARETLNNLKDRFLALSTPQKIALIAIPILTLVALIALITLATKPNYTVLYSGLSQEDMSAVMVELDKEGINYKVGQDGRSILVPEQQARDIRLKLAAKGIPSKGIVGYEVFDRTGMGVSDFQNQVNFKRAVEGELARTILRMSGIEDVRVNIGMPQRSIFLREEEEPTASVFVKLKPGYELTPEQVKAIRNLVSASVPRLKPKNVVVVDDKGRDLTAMLDEAESTVQDKELRLKAEFERRLEREVQKALEEALGFGTVKVKVSADLDFTKREQREEIYDPDMTAVVSQQKKRERTTTGGIAGIPGAQANIPPGAGAVAGAGQVLTERSETITNYEVSKKEVYSVDPLIKVRRLSVGVLVDSNIKDLDLEKIRRIVSASAGIDTQRGDVITVEAIPFQKPVFEKPAPDYENYIRLGLLALLVLAITLASLLILRKLLKRKEVPPLPVLEGQPPLEVIEGAEEIRIKAEKVEAVEAIVKTAKEEPEKVAKIIKGWLRSKG